MRRKKRFPNFNRGLALALILFLVVGVYAAVDTLSFQRQTEEIERLVRDYVEESAQLAVLPAPYNQRGQAADTEVVQRSLSEAEMLLRQYWSFRSDEYGFNQSEALLGNVREALQYNAQGLGSITSAKAMVQYVHSIRKTGSNRAEISFSYAGSIKYVGSVSWLIFNSGQTQEDYSSAYFRSGGDGAEVESEVVRQVSPSGDITARLIRLGGEWKIDSVNSASVFYE